MFDNLKCVTRSVGSAASYVADRMEHAQVEANVDDALQLAKKIDRLQSEGGLAVSLFNSFQNGKKIVLTLEENEND
jgi:hypothetical protein